MGLVAGLKLLGFDQQVCLGGGAASKSMPIGAAFKARGVPVREGLLLGIAVLLGLLSSDLFAWGLARLLSLESWGS